MINMGIDAGYGYTKGINEEGKKVVFPSVVSNGFERPLAKLFSNDDNIMDNLHIQVFNMEERKDYFVGGLAMKQAVSSSYILDEDRTSDNETKILIMTAAALLCGDDSHINLVTGLPLELYIHQRDSLCRTLENTNHLVTFPEEDKTIRICFDNVVVFPQAAGAVYDAVLKNAKQYLINNTYIGLIDIGYKTTDYIVFSINGGLNFEPELSGTLDIGISRVMTVLDSAFTRKSGSKLDMSELNALHANGNIYFKGSILDFTKEKKEANAELARSIKSKIEAVWGNKINVMNTVFISGGGGIDLYPYLKNFGTKTIIADDPQMANAKGFLQIAQMNV